MITEKPSKKFKYEMKSEEESIKRYFTIETYDVTGLTYRGFTQEYCGCLKLYPATMLQAAINKLC